MKPALLDLFCCQGGASVGYARAGWRVDGVDNERRHGLHYPFDFHVGDALAFVERHGRKYQAIHASPPCQHASAGTRYQDRSKYPTLIEPTREVLDSLGVPYVIENVEGARKRMRNAVLLCGSMFDLTTFDENEGVQVRLERHRLFESTIDLWPPQCYHDPAIKVAGAYGAAPRTIAKAKIRGGGYVPRKPVIERLLGIDWMTQYGLFQSLPPVYTQWIGERLLETIEGK